MSSEPPSTAPRRRLHHYDPFEYCPRRNLPVVSASASQSSPVSSSHFVILWREPADDYLPRYILRDIRPSVPPDEIRLLRVSLLDITGYVNSKELETYENRRFTSLDTDFLTFHAWVRKCKQDRERRTLFPELPTDLRCLSRSRHVDVVIASHREQTDADATESSTTLRLPLLHDITKVNGISELIQSPVSTNKSNDLVYEPSRVLEHKDVLGRRYYLVAWKELPDERATWLTSDELEELGVPDIESRPHDEIRENESDSGRSD
jgi:hypothetical protein